MADALMYQQQLAAAAAALQMKSTLETKYECHFSTKLAQNKC
jgi:hypothetical protein